MTSLRTWHCERSGVCFFPPRAEDGWPPHPPPDLFGVPLLEVTKEHVKDCPDCQVGWLGKRLKPVEAA